MGADPKDRAGAGELYAWCHAQDPWEESAERGGGQWTYPPLKEAMREAGFEGIRKAVSRRQNTVAQYITTRPILYLCERAMQRVGERVSWRWWNQEVIDLKAAKEMAAEAMATDWESESEAEVETESEVGREERSESSGVSRSSGAEWSRAE